MKQPKENLVITTVTLAIAVPQGEICTDPIKREIYIAGVIRNHLLGQKVRAETPNSPLLGYAIHTDAMNPPDVPVVGCDAKTMETALADALDPANPAVELIKFIVESRIDEPEALMHCWSEGDFDSIRCEWPEVPESVFEGLESSKARARSQAKAAEYHAKHPDEYADRQQPSLS